MAITSAAAIRRLPRSPGIRTSPYRPGMYTEFLYAFRCSERPTASQRSSRLPTHSNKQLRLESHRSFCRRRGWIELKRDIGRVSELERRAKRPIDLPNPSVGG